MKKRHQKNKNDKEIFIKELPELKNYIVILPHNVDEQLSYLTTQQLKKLKRDIKRLNVKTIIEKEPIIVKNNLRTI